MAKSKFVLPKTLTTVTGFSKFIALCLFILLPFAGAMIGMRYQAKVDSVKTTTTTADPTLSWKTYTNTSLGYTIRYPDTIDVKSLGERDLDVTRIGVKYGGQGGKVPYGGMAIYYRGSEGLEKGVDLPAPSTKIAFNGQPALRAKYNETGPYQIDYFIADSQNKRVVRFLINTSGDTGYEKETFDIFNQMVSTFKFTN